MLAREPGKPKPLNYYTIQGCSNWEGYRGQALADWQIEVIKLCATQKASNVKKAQRIAAKHRPKPATETARNERVRPPVSEPALVGSTALESHRNEGVRPPVSAAPSLPETTLNEGTRPPGPLPLLEVNGRRPPVPVSPVVRATAIRKPKYTIEDLKMKYRINLASTQLTILNPQIN